MGKQGSYRPPRVPAYKPTGAMRKSTAASMRKLAGHMKDRHPDLGAHEHISDAAQALDRNQPEAANRHLTAAIGNMTPQSLRRHGLLTDDQHDAAKRSMDAVHRHMLLVKDIIDLQSRNSQLPHSEAAEGDDDLTVRPTARQPGGDRALNAPDTTSIGKIDINVTKPQSVTRPKTAEQIAAANSGDLTVAVDLATAYRYRHGWIKIAPGQADAVRATASRIDSGRHDPASARAGLHLRQAAALMDQGELSERGHEEARTHLAQAADFRPDMSGEVQGHIARLDSAGAGAAPPDVGHRAYDRSSDTPLKTSLGRLNLMGRVLPTIQAAGDPLDPIDLGFHFNPLEARGKGGQWTKADVATLASDIFDTADKAHKSSDYGGAGTHLDNAAMSLRKGNYHDAAAHLERASQELHGYGNVRHMAAKVDEHLARVRSINLPDSKYTGQLEDENQRLQDMHPTLPLPGSAEDMNIAGFSNISLSADTGRLASTPHPFGKPGGPGLWGVKGMQLPPYVQNIAHALLRTGRAKSEGQAIAMARAATKRWATGKNVHPEVRAAAAGADADWRAKQAIAHAHASYQEGLEMAFDPAELRGPRGEWIRAALAAQVQEKRRARAAEAAKIQRMQEHQRAQLAASIMSAKARKPQAPVEVVPPASSSGRYSAENWRGAGRSTRMTYANDTLADRVVELVGTAAGAAQDSRTPLGTFGTAGQGGKPPAKGAPAKGGKQPPAKGGKPTAKPSGHAAHVAHEKHLIQGQINANVAKISALVKQRKTMLAALASAGGKVSSGQSGAKTAANATTKSSAAATTASTAASTAASAAATTASTASTAAKSATSTAASSGSSSKAVTARLSAQIAGINSQIAGLRAQDAQLAKKMAAIK